MCWRFSVGVIKLHIAIVQLVVYDETVHENGLVPNVRPPTTVDGTAANTWGIKDVITKTRYFSIN
jgi:hypothetical protein